MNKGMRFVKCCRYLLGAIISEYSLVLTNFTNALLLEFRVKLQFLLFCCVMDDWRLWFCSGNVLDVYSFVLLLQHIMPSRLPEGVFV